MRARSGMQKYVIRAHPKQVPVIHVVQAKAAITLNMLGRLAGNKAPTWVIFRAVER